MVSGSASYTYLYDGNGNVGQMINDSTTAIEAHYEYDPYGNSILESGSLAQSNSYRFSTKYFDTDSGLYYYGYRYYDPETGRWLSRDLISEEGGLNLYAFANNEPISYIDALGLIPIPNWLNRIVLGTFAHTKFTIWGRAKFPFHIFNRELKTHHLAKDSTLKPDVVDARGKIPGQGSIWDLKPASHEKNRILQAADDAKMRLYLSVLNFPPNITYRMQKSEYGCKYFVLGDPTEIIQTVTYVDEVKDLRGNKYDMYIYPSPRRGYILYYLFEKEKEKKKDPVKEPDVNRRQDSEYSNDENQQNFPNVFTPEPPAPNINNPGIAPLFPFIM